MRYNHHMKYEVTFSIVVIVLMLVWAVQLVASAVAMAATGFADMASFNGLMLEAFLWHVAIVWSVLLLRRIPL